MQRGTMTELGYEITLGRAALALLGGAICGAVLITAMSFVPMVLRPQLLDSWGDVGSLAAYLLLVTFAQFASGLLVLAAPAWWLLHRFGYRGPLHAAICGVTLTFVSYLAYSEFSRRHLGMIFWGPAPISVFMVPDFWPWPIVLEGGAWYSIAGGLAGLLIWRIAYRPSALRQ